MNHRMVLAALGAPESKVREQQSGDPNGARYEEWIYGHVPQTVRFVRFVGDRVTVVEIAALGKPVEIHDKEVYTAGYTSSGYTEQRISCYKLPQAHLCRRRRHSRRPPP